MNILKQSPEDFIVREVSTIKPKRNGRFLYFRLQKRDLTIHEALNRLAKALHVHVKNFSYAGIKDRRAITEQTCGVFNVSKEQLERVQLADIKVSFLGFGDEPVHLGDLEGNNFEIIIRNIEKEPKINCRFRNLFGEQRFSLKNVEIGRFLVKRKFREAAELVAEIDKLEISGNDFVGALRKIPRKQLLFFIHAFQSYLWNRAALKSDKEELLVVGFGTVVEDQVTKQVLEEENIKPRDFIIKELPEISAEGSVRKVWAEAKNLKAEHDSKEKTLLLKFSLSKGCYATEFVRQNL